MGEWKSDQNVANPRSFHDRRDPPSSKSDLQLFVNEIFPDGDLLMKDFRSPDRRRRIGGIELKSGTRRDWWIQKARSAAKKTPRERMNGKQTYFGEFRMSLGTLRHRRERGARGCAGNQDLSPRDASRNPLPTRESIRRSLPLPTGSQAREEEGEEPCR